MKWISVADMLPDNDQRVLVWWDCWGRPRAEIVEYGAAGPGVPECWYIGDGYDAYGVTHWMPLPESPDEPRYTITEAGRAMLRDAQQGVE